MKNVIDELLKKLTSCDKIIIMITTTCEVDIFYTKGDTKICHDVSSQELITALQKAVDYLEEVEYGIF